MTTKPASVICIGGSAGSLTPLTTLVSAFPKNMSIPIVVCIHRGMPVGTISTPRLVNVLRRSTGLVVTEVEDLDSLTPGIHIAPPGYHTLVAGNALALSPEPPESYSLPSIDVLFESAAQSHGAGVVAVVLSCANTDGVDGVGYVAAAGGTIIVQDPETAEHDTLIRAILLEGELRPTSSSPDMTRHPDGQVRTGPSKSALTRSTPPIDLPSGFWLLGDDRD